MGKLLISIHWTPDEDYFVSGSQRGDVALEETVVQLSYLRIYWGKPSI
jgi:hypothetical protein